MSHEDIQRARQVRLDPDRSAAALRRVRTAIMAARHHERQASVERAKARQLVRTWELCSAARPADVLPHGCCGDPDNCPLRERAGDSP